MSKISIICRQSKFEDLKEALNAIGVSGITVTSVLGCGTQKGTAEYYRGVPVEFTLLPKTKVEVVVSAVPVEKVVDAAKEALYTGHIGDGKIFVYDVEDYTYISCNSCNHWSSCKTGRRNRRSGCNRAWFAKCLCRLYAGW